VEKSDLLSMMKILLFFSYDELDYATMAEFYNDSQGKKVI
jgi:hypothetical protein